MTQDDFGLYVFLTGAFFVLFGIGDTVAFQIGQWYFFGSIGALLMLAGIHVRTNKRKRRNC